MSTQHHFFVCELVYFASKCNKQSNVKCEESMHKKRATDTKTEVMANILWLRCLSLGAFFSIFSFFDFNSNVTNGSGLSRNEHEHSVHIFIQKFHLFRILLELFYTCLVPFSVASRTKCVYIFTIVNGIKSAFYTQNRKAYNKLSNK